MSFAETWRSSPKTSEEQHRLESPYLSEEGRKIRDAVRALLPLIREHAQQGEDIGALPEPTLKALDATGYFRLSMPIEYGGLALGARDIVEIIEAAGMADGSTGWNGFVAGGIRNVLPFSEQAKAEIFAQSKSWVGPLAVGASIFSTIVGQARRVDGGFMVKGKWLFGSGCKHAAWAVVGFEWQENGEALRGMGVLSRDQFEILDDWHVMGMKATSSNSLIATEEVFVPEHRMMKAADLPRQMMAQKGKYSGLGYRTGPLGLMVTTALSNVAINLGMAKGCLAEFIRQANARAPFNLPYPTVAEAPSTQVAAGRLHATINSAEALIYRAADEVDRRALLDQDFAPREESLYTMDLVYAANLCAQAIDTMQLVLGSSTVALKNPIQRFVRDARVLITHGAIRLDPFAEIAGRHVLGLPPFSMFAGGLVQR